MASLLCFRDTKKYKISGKVTKKLSKLKNKYKSGDIIENQNIMNGESILLDTLMQQRRFPVNIKIKRAFNNLSIPRQLPQTEVLTICNNKRVEKVKCLTKDQERLYISMNLPKPVMFTPVENNNDVFPTIGDVKKNIRKHKIIWIVVTTRFSFNSRVYDVGEVLEIVKPSLLKRILRLLQRKRTKVGLTVVSHPNKERIILPHRVEGNFKKCVSPYTSCYRLINDLVHHEPMPFLVTVPVNPSTGVVLNDRKVTTTKNNQRLLVVGKEIFNVMTVIHEDESIEDFIIPNSACVEVEVIENNSNITIMGEELQARQDEILNNLDSLLNSSSTGKQDNITKDNAGKQINIRKKLVDKVNSMPTYSSTLKFEVNRRVLTTSPSTTPTLVSLKRTSLSGGTSDTKCEISANSFVPGAPNTEQIQVSDITRPKATTSFISQNDLLHYNVSSVNQHKNDTTEIEEDDCPEIPVRTTSKGIALSVLSTDESFESKETFNKFRTLPKLPDESKNKEENTDKFRSVDVVPNKVEAEPYLVPVTGFTSNDNHVIKALSTVNEEKNVRSPIFSLDVSHLVEVGGDGYVLVPKRQIQEVAPILRTESIDAKPIDYDDYELAPETKEKPILPAKKPRPAPRPLSSSPVAHPRPHNKKFSSVHQQGKSACHPVPPPRPRKARTEITIV